MATTPTAKKGLGSIKIGKYICPLCGEQLEEDRSFWENIKASFFDLLNMIYSLMSDLHVSYKGIASMMELIFPRGKDPGTIKAFLAKYPYNTNEIITMTLIWSGIILTYGVKRSRNLSIDRSMISACALVLWLVMLI